MSRRWNDTMRDTEKQAPSWSAEDKARFEDLVETTLHQCRIALEAGDLNLVKEIDELLIGIAVVKQLWLAFKSSPEPRIDGPEGVAKLLDLSRNAVYCRLNALKLDPDDFKGPEAEPYAIIRKSPVLRKLMKKVPTLADEAIQEAGRKTSAERNKRSLATSTSYRTT